MSFTITLTEEIVEGSTNIKQVQSYTAKTVLKMSEEVADGVTDQSHLLAIDISALQVFYMVSNVALTVETNNASTPQETFTLTANKPVTWRSGDTAIFAGDVTALFLTNSSGSASTFQLLAGLDV